MRVSLKLERQLESPTSRKRRLNHKKHFSIKVFDETELVGYKDQHIIIPKPLQLQSKIIQWCHHYISHPGHTQLEEIIAMAMY